MQILLAEIGEIPRTTGTRDEGRQSVLPSPPVRAVISALISTIMITSYARTVVDSTSPQFNKVIFESLFSKKYILPEFNPV